MDTNTSTIDDWPDAGESAGRILIVDDNQTTRIAHRALLASRFDVTTCESGEEAIDLCRRHLPDLVLLDIQMPGIDGIETCRRLREWTNVPIVFVTGNETFDEHLRAYDAGGDDLVVKPVQSVILLRKVALAIRRHRAGVLLAEERTSLQTMAMNFLSTAGQNGALLNFMRVSMASRTYRDLANHLLQTACDLGIDCSVMLRHEGGPTVVTSHGEASEIERAILEQSSTMGRIFQFKRRLAVNYDKVSIIVANMPDEDADSESAGRIRDNLAILAETAEALCETVGMRLESMRRAEQLQVALGGAVNAVESLRVKYLHMLGDTRLLLQDLVNKVERRYGWLGATRKEEAEMTEELHAAIRSILGMLAEGGDFDRQFEQVLGALRGGDSADAVELF